MEWNKVGNILFEAIEITYNHYDVIKWKHFPRYWPFVRGIHRFPVNSPHKGQWRVALMFSLICVWINGWVNNRGAGDLRRYHAHYDVTVMLAKVYPTKSLQKTVLNIRTICYRRDLWKFAQSCKQLRLLCTPKPWNLPGTALLCGFQSSRHSTKKNWNGVTKPILVSLHICGSMQSLATVPLWGEPTGRITGPLWGKSSVTLTKGQ